VKDEKTTINVAASGIALASGSALVGEALLGPAGAVVGAVVGLGIGIAAEIYSPKKEDHVKKISSGVSSRP
jgi:hypothetical protein